MPHDYRRDSLAEDGPKVSGVIGGLRQDRPGPLASVDGAYAEAQLDAAGNLRVVEPDGAADLQRQILEQLVILNEQMALLLQTANN